MFFELRQYRIFPGKRDEWKNELEPRAREMNDLARMVVMRIEATPKSVIQ